MERIQKMYCDYFDLSIESILTSTGLSLTIHGTYGLFYTFLEKMIQFKQRLETKIQMWKNEISKGEIASGKNTHYFRREQVSIRREAV